MKESSRNITIQKGSILIYRVFDIAEEVTLSMAENLLLSETSSGSRFKLTKDPRKAIIIREAPLTLSLPKDTLRIPDKDNFRELPVELSAKIWNYGVISILIQYSLPENISWEELVTLGSLLEGIGSKTIDDFCYQQAEGVKAKLLPAIKNPHSWTTFEDYITYFFEKINEYTTAEEFIEKADLPALILAEPSERLSNASKKAVLENYHQYSETDLAIIDWNSAVLFDSSGLRDVADVIEFALTHLLELRYYDDLLDKKLGQLSNSIDNPSKHAISNYYSKVSRDASRQYMEFSEFLGRIENSLKTVGDFYLATIFRAASKRFRFTDWQHEVSQKMEKLANIAEVLQGEVNAHQSHIMEIIVIILITIEVVPALKEVWHLFKYLSKVLPTIHW